MSSWLWCLLLGACICETVLRVNMIPVIDLKDIQPYISSKPGGRDLFSKLKHQFAGQLYYMNTQVDLKTLRLGVGRV